MAELTSEHEFVRALSALANSKGSPGSVRTMLAWITYRMRNLTAGSRWERAALSGYRLIGYGERPGPASITWLASAAVAVPIANGLDSLELFWSGLGDYLHLWWDYVLSPLHLLKLGGDDNISGSRELVARILVAFSFVTASLAARKYVKSDREKP